ncbi:MAG: hypothetical protein PVH18_10335 [Chloroflexota bacterium]
MEKLLSASQTTASPHFLDRLAETTTFAEGTIDSLGDQILIGAVARLMQSKTGDVPDRPGGMLESIFALVGEETGLSVEAIQAPLADGQSLGELIESNGGDIEAVREATIDAFEALPNAGQFDAEQQADQWLSNQQPVQE